MKINNYLSCFLMLIHGICHAQINQSGIDTWIEKQAYNNPDSKDSLLIWSDLLLKASKELNYPRAEAYSIRLKGLYYDFNNEPSEATRYYLAFLDKSKAYNNLSDEMSATSDLVYIYFQTDQLKKAKPLILSFTNSLEKNALNQKKLAVFYSNLGIIYRKEQKEDSAIVAYAESLKIRENLKDEKGLITLRINLSSLLVNTKRYKEALKLTEQNLAYLEKNNNRTDLWYNLVNKAGALDGLKRYDECLKYLDNALILAKELGSKTFEQLTYEQFSSTFANQKKHEQAFEYLRKSIAIKADLINEETNKKIAELQEQHNADEREKRNQLLNTQLEAQKNKQNAYIVGIIALIILSTVIGYTYYKNRKKNVLIAAQNQKLKDLNTEKNHLISIVSHDLSSPFSTIKLWLNTLDSKSSEKEFEVAKGNILKTVSHGLQTIKRVLDIDKNAMKEIDYEKIDIADLIKELIILFEPLAKQKSIAIKVRIGHESESILSDKNMLLRVLSNLLSNAIKFSNLNSDIIFSTEETGTEFSFTVQDFGIGIPQNQMSDLFQRYSNVAANTNNLEDSTGLGLSIVKRLTNELGGELFVESQLGTGTKFKITLRK